MRGGLHPVVMILLVCAAALFGRVLPTWTLSLATVASDSVQGGSNRPNNAAAHTRAIITTGCRPRRIRSALPFRA